MMFAPCTVLDIILIFAIIVLLIVSKTISSNGKWNIFDMFPWLIRILVRAIRICRKKLVEGE